MIQIMKNHYDGNTIFLVEAAQKVQYIQLVRDVQIGRGFIQKQQSGFLRQCHGDPCPLLLTSRKPLHFSMFKGTHACTGKSPLNDLPILFAETA